MTILRTRKTTSWIVALLLLGSASACGEDGADNSITTVTDPRETETTEAGSGTTAVGATVDLSYPIVCRLSR